MLLVFSDSKVTSSKTLSITILSVCQSARQLEGLLLFEVLQDTT